MILYLVTVIVVTCWLLWLSMGQFDLDARLKTLKAAVSDQDARLAPAPAQDPENVPTFVSGPSCAVCNTAVDPDTAIRVDTVVPLIGGAEIPARMFIHQWHAEVPVEEANNA